LEVLWVALTLIKGLGPKLTHRLLRAFATPADVFKASPGLLRQALGGYPVIVSRIEAGPDINGARSILARVDDLGGRLVTIADGEYPLALKQISDAPTVLYVKGRPLDSWGEAVAIVGTRMATGYGLKMARRIAEQLARAGVVVISGMARGIDTAAHKGALAAGGATIAVWGSGLDVVYPNENQWLAQEIAGNGAILTEYPPGTDPEPFRFPERNRIISGLSAGVVVVECRHKSGALRTVEFGCDQGREIMAVPGPVTRPESAGPNQLLYDGASLVRCGDDVIHCLGGMGQYCRLDGCDEMIGPIGSVNTDHIPAMAGIDPSDLEAVVEALTGFGGEPATAGDVAEATQMPAAKVQVLLSVLEMCDTVRSCGLGKFVAEGF